MYYSSLYLGKNITGMLDTGFKKLQESMNRCTGSHDRTEKNVENIIKCHTVYQRDGLTHSHTMTPFDAPGKQAFWKHWKREKLLVMSNFSFSHIVFYPFG